MNATSEYVSDSRKRKCLDCGKAWIANRREHAKYNEWSPCCGDSAILAREYPQGWAYYPGDTCKHGTYTGGCGIDRMCGACEMGE